METSSLILIHNIDVYNNRLVAHIYVILIFESHIAWILPSQEALGPATVALHFTHWVRLSVRTFAFHVNKTGSIPVPSTNFYRRVQMDSDKSSGTLAQLVEQ